MNAKTAAPLVVAHRGASALAPENTLAAFRKAAEDGAEGIEFDVRLTKDRVPVIFHDETLGRLTDDKNLVSNLTCAELAEFDVGSWFARRQTKNARQDFSAERIPTLEKTLLSLRDFRGWLYIELKCREAEIEPLVRAVSEQINDSPLLLPRVIIKSFQLEVIPAVRRFCPAARTAALFAPKITTMMRKEKRLINIATDIGADMLSVHFSLATKRFVKKAEEKNLPVTIWTADHERWMRRAIDLRLFAVITNNPARLLTKKAELLER